MPTESKDKLSAEENWIVDRVKQIIDTGEYPDLKDSERQGIRAYLQRAETRLSTYQRVAGVFLNGAGLDLLYFRGRCEKSYLQSKGDVRNDRERQQESQEVQQRVQD